MALLTRYGTQWGAIPMTAGKIIWVAPTTAPGSVASGSYVVGGQTYSASNNNSGLSPENAVATINQAQSLVTAGSGDVIALLPGTHTATAAVAASTAGVSYIGLPYGPTSDRLEGICQVSVTGTASDIFAVTASDIGFYNINFIPITAKNGVTFTAAAHNLRFKHCSLDMRTPVGNAATKGWVATGATQAPRHLRIQGCYILAGSATTSQSYAIDVGAAFPWLIENSTFFHDGTVASVTAWLVAIKVNDNANGVIRDNEFVNSALGGAGVTKWLEAVAMTGISVVHASRNIMGINTGGLLLDDFAAADVDLALNYIATVAGGTGGTLITATT